MSVYLNGAAALFSPQVGQRTSKMLGQPTTLPYFNAFDSSLLSLPQLYAEFERQIDRTLQQVGWEHAELNHIPILLGSTAYVISDCEARLADQQPLPTEHSLAMIANWIQKRYQTQVFSFATSCTSSAQAIGYAYKMLKNGTRNKVLVLGFEMFNRLMFEHFQSMNLLSFNTSYLPIIQSDGIILGEGISCVALSSSPYSDLSCEMLGVTSLTDNDNLTNSSETALRRLLCRCLANAGLSDTQIQAIKVHGVGGNSDAMEQQILTELFPQAEWILTKPYMGHTLGASGALETAFFLQCLQQGKIPELPVSLESNSSQHYPLAHNKPLKCGYYLHYFLGFGGSHIAWITRVSE